MKSPKEILDTIRAVFTSEPAPAAPDPASTPAPAAPVTLAAKSYKLKDGTDISVSQAGDALAVGDIVMVGGSPAPAGEHTLEDGTVITTDAEGKITVIVEANPVTTDLSTEPAPPTIEQRIAQIEQSIAQLKTPAPPTGFASETALQKANETITKHEATIQAMFGLLEKLVDAPMAEPKTLTGNKKELFEKNERVNKTIDRISAARKNMKVQA